MICIGSWYSQYNLVSYWSKKGDGNQSHPLLILAIHSGFPVENVTLTDVDAVLVEQVGQLKTAHAFLTAYSDSLAIRLAAFDKRWDAVSHRSVDDSI